MKKGFLFVLMLVLASLVPANVLAAEPALDIEYVKINGEEVAASGNEILSVMRGEELDIKVKVVPSSDLEDLDAVRLRAFIEGYDSRNLISDVSQLFDVEAGVSYYKSMKVEIPSDIDLVDENGVGIRYKLRILVSDRYSENVKESTYTLDFASKRHDIAINDVVMSPEGSVKAGNYLTLSARVENIGKYDEEDVKVEFTIPGLGKKEVVYLDEIASYDSMSTNDVYMMIPECAEGNYDVKVKVSYHRGEEVSMKTESINVVESSTCDVGSSTGSAQNTFVTMPSNVEGKVGSLTNVPIVIANNENSQKTYVISVTGVDAFGTYTMDRTNAVVSGNGVANFNLKINPETVGDYGFTVSVISGNEVKNLPVYMSVAKEDANGISVNTNSVMKVVLIAAIVVLVVVIALVLIRRFTSNDEVEESEEGDNDNYY